jgi:hypothetical protein
MMCVVKTLGSVSLSTTPALESVSPAQRATTPGWRDPRLWIGVAIIAASVVVGAKVMASADDTVEVWAVDRDLVAGDSITTDDLTARRVRFVSPEDLERYLLATESVVDGTRITRTVGEGELLPRSATGASLTTGVIEVPINVEPGQVPPSVGAGSIVNIWVAGGDVVASEDQVAVLVLEGVVVLEAPRLADDFGGAGQRQLVIGVPSDQADDLASALGAAASGQLVVTRQG